MNVSIKANPGELLYWTKFDMPDNQFPLCSIDKGSYIDSGEILTGVNFDWEEQCHSIQIGKYCALAADIKFIVDLNHDMGGVYQGYIPVLGGDTPRKNFKRKRKGQIIIQNDCWVGNGATILNGVTIHNGGVVGAGSCVTKDVPPYAIVAGNPAKIIGYRFDQGMINKLLRIAWWHWSDEKIVKEKDCLQGDIKEFVKKHDIEQDQHKEIYPPLIGGKRYLFYMDTEESWSLWKKVIRSFAVSKNKTSDELVIYYPEKTEEFQKSIDEFTAFLHELDGYDACLRICGNTLKNPEDLLTGADFYITNRSKENIRRMERAYLEGVVCISGVDIPLQF
ncbi:CatB-related O-acetyltransferase [Kineothrix sp. MSJ-39]|uniref:CatB-related O-acetyltransferase n=1 Tax=Kineothrix sp. MSJ-39 TaxID=2841533 RepID=UPI001C101BB8|nr:CatB-related O-acetyltransferase [Kineothrix sp. MSJ-39]MBU5431047.1 CatB-related O-acetyltransferase [Kineothrix sp. MSJ-39]